MLLFRTTIQHLAWAQMTTSGTLVQSGILLPEQPFPSELLDAIEEEDKAIYVLENGGAEITEPLSDLTPGMLSLVQITQKYAPYENTQLLHVIFHMVSMRPDMQHLLLCNTAFFRHMPQTARYYALPQSLQYPEIQRYGADGIYHQYASQKIRASFPHKSEKVISIYLDPLNPTLAAIQRGIAVECSSGFSKLEGIAGLTTCGNIDPSLPLLMVEDGISVEQALQAITTQSGLQAQEPELHTLETLYSDNMPDQFQQSRETLQYQLLKQIGSAAAILNGFQQLIFLNPSGEQNNQFIFQLAQKLEPLGVKSGTNTQIHPSGLIQFTEIGSSIEIYALQRSPWAVIAHQVTLF